MIEVVPPSADIGSPPYKQVRYWCQDESRIGLITLWARKLTARGIQPVGVEQWCWELFDNLDRLRCKLSQVLSRLTRSMIASITGWDFILDALFVANI